MDASGNACFTYHYKIFCHSSCRRLTAHKQALATKYKCLESFNKRSCQAHKTSMLAIFAPASAHLAYGRYTQPNLSRAPAPQRAQMPQKPPQRIPTPLPQFGAEPPPVSVVRTNKPNAASTLGSAQEGHG